MDEDDDVRPPLTDFQKRIFTYVRMHYETLGWSPTQEMIQHHFQIKHQNSVHDVLSRLTAKGYVKRTPRGMIPLYADDYRV